MEMKRSAVTIIIFSSSFMALVIFFFILSVRLYRASAIDSGKRIFSQRTFYQNIKNICLNSSYNTLLLLKTVKTWNISQVENKQLAKLLLVTRECLCLLFLHCLFRSVGKTSLGAQSGDLNLGLPYSRPTHYQLRHSAP
jgi:hypothetical protein